MKHWMVGFIVVISMMEWSGLSCWAQSELSDIPAGYEAHASRNSMFERANELYSNGELDKAAVGYRYLAEHGIANGYLYYNLGNTEFQLGNTGKAILWYERAWRYLPRFGDLRYNLNYARQTLVDEEFRQPGYSGTVGFFMGLHQFLNLRESMILLCLVFWLFAVITILRLLIRSEQLMGFLRIGTWVAGVALTLGILSTGYKIYSLYYEKEAIVQVSALEVKTGAGKDFSTHFTLHEGTKVRVLQLQEGWARIDLPAASGFTGYVPLDSIEII